MFTWVWLVIAMIQPAPQTILVTIDGSRYQDVYADNARQRFPNLYSSFVDQGIAVGKLTPMVASGPNHVSLPGYLEITRGHPSTDCQTNTCKPTIDRSILSFYEHTAVFSSWSEIHKTLVPGVYADIGQKYRPDFETQVAVFAYLHKTTPDFLWVSLGDTDEWGHHNNYPLYLAAFENADLFIGLLVSNYPKANIIVTCDHGRNRNFRDHGYGSDSERVWLMMRGPTVPHKGFVSAKSLSLSNIYPTISDLQTGSHSPDSILSRLQ